MKNFVLRFSDEETLIVEHLVFQVKIFLISIFMFQDITPAEEHETSYDMNHVPMLDYFLFQDCIM